MLVKLLLTKFVELLKSGDVDKTRFVDLLIKDKIFRYLDELVYEMEQRIGKWFLCQHYGVLQFCDITKK
ncbi:hypothetical protein RclHR1_03700006 [Rhizophagus clarus]|uniref:Uncharacterized protein n=1 Tax=Rhizophagus clarus TaxID=94130 RepID=A0A2Z6S776_9GLOM|nr:hypothetical protein RclHR1_03700006 [Rhizophagus clarus]